MIEWFFSMIMSFTVTATLVQEPEAAEPPFAPAAGPPAAAPAAPAPQGAGKEREARPREIIVGEQPAANTREREIANNMRPFLFLEIRFATAVCDLSHEQRQLIAKRAKPVIDDLAKDLAKQEEKEGRPEPIATKSGDPERRLLHALGIIIRTLVPAERWDRYEHELRKRAADRKRSIIDNVAAALDRELALSPAQRQALASALAEEWKEEWSWYSVLEMDSEAWLPAISDRRIAPILSDTQHTAFRKLGIRAPERWENFSLAAEIYEASRTAEECEIEKAAGFESDTQ